MADARQVNDAWLARFRRRVPAPRSFSLAANDVEAFAFEAGIDPGLAIKEWPPRFDIEVRINGDDRSLATDNGTLGRSSHSFVPSPDAGLESLLACSARGRPAATRLLNDASYDAFFNPHQRSPNLAPLLDLRNGAFLIDQAAGKNAHLETRLKPNAPHCEVDTLTLCEIGKRNRVCVAGDVLAKAYWLPVARERNGQLPLGPWDSNEGPRTALHFVRPARSARLLSARHAFDSAAQLNVVLATPVQVYSGEAHMGQGATARFTSRYRSLDDTAGLPPLSCSSSLVAFSLAWVISRLTSRSSL